MTREPQPPDPHPDQVPPGYPRARERRLVLADGRTIWARPIVPSDAAALAEAFETADPEILDRRFLGGPPHVTPQLLEHLCGVDYAQRFALVAVDPETGRGVGIAR
jgi:hypothetical protein